MQVPHYEERFFYFHDENNTMCATVDAIHRATLHPAAINGYRIITAVCRIVFDMTAFYVNILKY